MNNKPTEREIADYIQARKDASFWWRQAYGNRKFLKVFTKRAMFYDDIANAIGKQYGGDALDVLLNAHAQGLRRLYNSMFRVRS